MATNDSTLGLSDLRLAVVRHKKKAFATFCLIVIVAAAVAVLAPKRYHSGSLLLVRLGKENATLDPTVTLGPEPVVAVPASREGELNSIVEIVKSLRDCGKGRRRPGGRLHSRAFSGHRKHSPAGGLDSTMPQSTPANMEPVQGAIPPTGRNRCRPIASWQFSKCCRGQTRRLLRKSELIQIDCKGPSPQRCREGLSPR